MPLYDEGAKMTCETLELELGHTQPHWQILNCDNFYEIEHLIFIPIFLQAVCFLGNVY